MSGPSPSPETVHARLSGAYPAPRKTRRDPLDELILTVLSQNTNDANRDRGWRRLRERFDDWAAVRRAPAEEVEEAIRPAGLAGQKTKTIRGILERLARERGEAKLAHLDSMEDEEALEYLTGFHGVGTKTAACVLAFALRRPVLPVDTHVHRLAVRLGLVPENASAVRTHGILNRDVPEGLRLELHLLLIRHGRAVCTARRPSCSECVLAPECPRVGVEEPE